LYFDPDLCGVRMDEIVLQEQTSEGLAIQVWCILCKVEVSKVSDGLIGWLTEQLKMPFSERDYNSKFAQEYNELGEMIIARVIEKVDRLIDFMRTEKNQSALKTYRKAQSGHFIQPAVQLNDFDAKVTLPSGLRYEFRPQYSKPIILAPVTFYDPFADALNGGDWEHIRAFVTGKRRPDLIFELLARAEELASNNYGRSALIEAVTALEVAVGQFAREENTLAGQFASRMGLDSLKSQVEHLGFSATIRYLLPLLLNEIDLPTQTIKTCQEAIKVRNNVVHQGQRDVLDVEQYIKSIHSCCEVLNRFVKRGS
jgi:hypothetical protein